MAAIITSAQEEAPRAVGGIKNSSSIKKNSLNFQEKAWWTLIQHRLSPNLLDNVVGPDKASLIVGKISSYENDIAKWIAQEIRDRSNITNTILAFPFLLIQIYLDAGVQEFPGINRFLRPKTTIDMGLIKDVSNLISKMTKLATSMVSDTYEA
ncbi:hypothetical protein FXO38_00027 [Capsicum annuum]|nr:hypothetical protein FXO38_00027 [Capsicum annuum]KAF3686045.1 hypothetical protein FXO37_00019 [Capsicum annuum]